LRSGASGIAVKMTQWGKVVSVSNLQAAGTTLLEIQVDDLPSLPAERNLAEGIKILYQTCQLYDLNLVVGTTRLPAHKVVLASMSRACCEQVQKAVKDFQQRQPPSPSSASSDLEKAEKAEKAPTSGPEEKTLQADLEVATTSSLAQVPAASPPIYSNQWKAPSSTAPVPPVAINAKAEPAEGKNVPPEEPQKTLEEPTVPSLPAPTRPEMHLDIASPEAARALLDLVYGLGSEYNISSDAANQDVLRLATQLDVPCLQESATRYLGQNLTCQNAVSRLQTCKEFGLEEMYGAIEEEVVYSRDALQRIAAAEEVIKFPEILQGLLVRSAQVHNPVPNLREGKEAKRKRIAEQKSGRPEKLPKASSGRAVAGGGA